MSLRPYLYEFLDYVSKDYEIIVFCNGGSIYCSGILDRIESQKKYFAYRLDNTHVVFENTNFSVKFYDVLFGAKRTINNTVIVDSNVGSYSLNLFSGIPMLPYKTYDPTDKELIHLANYLDTLAKCDSIQCTIKEKVQQTIML